MDQGIRPKKGCAVVQPTFVRQTHSNMVEGQSTNFHSAIPTTSVQDVSSMPPKDLSILHSDKMNLGPAPVPLIPVNVYPPILPIYSTMPQIGPAHNIHPNSIYIAQPININLEVKPKIHLPIPSINEQPQSNANPTPAKSSTHTEQLANLHSTNVNDQKQTQHNCDVFLNGEGGDCWNTAVSGWEEATLIKNKIGLVINRRYKIVQSIASGSYGAIFVADDLWNESKQRVAVKFDAACKDDHLKYEFDVYKSVLYDDGMGKVEGFPRVYWYGHEYGHNILVMELLGAPLASLFAFCDRSFGRETIVSLGVQMIERIRHLHKRGFIHRDIKPENFLIGIGEKENTCYLIDFGLARRYRFRENRDLKHIPYRRGRSFVGTAKYASLNGHKGVELSRRDDLESLGYVLIELINGNLPWKNISKRNTAYTKHQTSMKIRMMKEQTIWADVCPTMSKFINYCRELPFFDDPDYDILLELIRSIVVNEKPEINLNLEQIGCGSCASVIKKQTLNSLHNSSHIHTVVSPITPKLIVEENGATHNPAIPTRNMFCQLPLTLMKPVEECVASLRSLSIAAAAAAAATAAVTSNNLSIMPTINNTVVEPVGNLMFGRVQISPKLPEHVSEDDSDSTTSCRRCQKRLQTNGDQQQRRNGDERLPSPQNCQMPMENIESFDSNSQKMSWQVWRESTLDRRFQYENRFSWTLCRGKSKLSPQKSSKLMSQNSGNHFLLDGVKYDMRIPPPPIPECIDICMQNAKPKLHRNQKSEAKLTNKSRTDEKFENVLNLNPDATNTSALHNLQVQMQNQKLQSQTQSQHNLPHSQPQSQNHHQPQPQTSIPYRQPQLPYQQSLQTNLYVDFHTQNNQQIPQQPTPYLPSPPNPQQFPHQQNIPPPFLIQSTPFNQMLLQTYYPPPPIPSANTNFVAPNTFNNLRQQQTFPTILSPDKNFASNVTQNNIIYKFSP